jgi:4-aminobutyrate aminotransferase-like enzyme
VSEALSRGLLLLKAGVHGNCIRVLAPLVISDAELDEALHVWDSALEAALPPASKPL